MSVLITVGVRSDSKEKKNTLIHLRRLFDDFEKYNQVIQAIDVKDQLEEVEFGVADTEGREALLQTLKEMKQDLNRALKVERK